MNDKNHPSQDGFKIGVGAVMSCSCRNINYICDLGILPG